MEFEKIKNLSAWELIKLLERFTRENAKKLELNGVVINDLLSKSTSKEIRDSIQEYQLKNKNIIAENAVYIKLHNELLSFLKSLIGKELVLLSEFEKVAKKPILKEQHKVSDFNAFFEKTIRGDVCFDQKHPFYKSIDFKEKLLAHYIENEQYEMCSVITKEQ